MSQINYHPAPGLGDLMNAWFVVPQNPLRTTPTVIVPSVQATAPGQILAKPRLGDFVAGTFVVPQNPIRKQLGLGGVGCAGCGCAGRPNYSGLQGFDFESIKTWAQEPSLVSAIPNWAFWGAGAALGYMLLAPGGKEYRAARSESRGYRRLARRLSNPRRKRNIEQGYWNATGFHPIRRSDDYEPDEVGERYQYVTRKKKAKRKR